MKAYIVVDIPVDDPAEIDEYGMHADLHVCPFVPSAKKELYFDVVKEIRPMPMKKASLEKWFAEGGTYLYTYNPNDYDKGWNDCVDFLEGELND